MIHPDIVHEIARQRAIEQERHLHRRTAADRAASETHPSPATPRPTLPTRLARWLGRTGAAESWQRHLAADTRRQGVSDGWSSS
ncbi:hypothetical protein HNR23_002654 [Nocardiopsis mwathae]|uniref:Uncharacterized protein n=1 Tax=Nocardiopsis mwathae TaxID=1472723 RepID=A0A7X0D715_9ACTN|nr:hypothetical protein [Nocardiopsis mwathae]MBB6172594.1 hypothetical protein [Nocardiopsis mwathae]